MFLAKCDTLGNIFVTYNPRIYDLAIQCILLMIEDFIAYLLSILQLVLTIDKTSLSMKTEANTINNVFYICYITHPFAMSVLLMTFSESYKAISHLSWLHEKTVTVFL